MTPGKLVKLISQPRYWKALAHRVAPGIEHGPALTGLRPKMVIDVGANKGQFAYFASILWRDAKIVCFEPLPAPRARLIKLLGERIVVHPVALGEAEGAATIHIASREDSSSLLPLARQSQIFDMRESASLEVEVRRLDQVIKLDPNEATLLKIDVQGFEYQVLSGASDILPQVDWIYVEASFLELYKNQKLANEVEALLSKHGFRMSGKHNRTIVNGELVQADLLFTADRSLTKTGQTGESL